MSFVGTDRLASDEDDELVTGFVGRWWFDGGNGGYEGRTGVLFEKRFTGGFFDDGELADEHGGRISLDDEERGGEDEHGGRGGSGGSGGCGGGGICGTTTATWEIGLELFWFWHLSNYNLI